VFMTICFQFLGFELIDDKLKFSDFVEFGYFQTFSIEKNKIGQKANGIRTPKLKPNSFKNVVQDL